MRNLWLVARREYINRIRSGAYIASTAVIMLLFFGSTLLPAIFASRDKAEPMNVLLLDRTGQVAAPLRQALAAAPEGAREVTLEEASGEEGALTERIRKENAALLVVEGTYPGALKARYLAGNIGMLRDAGAVLGPLESIVRSARLQQSGINPSVAMEILRPLETETRQVTATDERDENAFGGSIMLALGAVMVIYILVLMNGTFIFQGVLEEKVSRVMEVMASSVRPGALMAGKILGLGALSMTQFALMLAAWLGGSAVAARMTDVPVQTPSPWITFNLITYLILGFTLSATLMAAAGATVSRMEDSQTVLMPITMIHVIPMMLLTPVMNNPDGTLATVLSIIPFFSPTVMIMRVVLTDVPVAQVALSMGLMVLATVLMVWAGGRVYRAAMLLYGARPSLRQIIGYLRAG